jgi:hypothetical protein
VIQVSQRIENKAMYVYTIKDIAMALVRVGQTKKAVEILGKAIQVAQGIGKEMKVSMRSG